MSHRAVKSHDLRDSALFNIGTRKKLASVLLCSPDHLNLVQKLEVKYKKRWKPKDSDTAPWLTQPPAPHEADCFRPIDIPVDPLKKLQGRIADLLSRVKAPPYLCSPVRGVSYVDNARAHIEGSAFWLLDIADYFPSCTANRVAWFFRTVMKCAPDVTAILVAIVTDSGRLPQGSPSSPILAYFSNLKMWGEVAALVHRAGCILSVYADDITISGKTVPGALVWNVKQTIVKNGFRLKREKEVSLVCCPADITGVIVRNGSLKLPNRQLKKIVETKKLLRASTDKMTADKLKTQIAGRLAQRRQIECASC
ncbi:reverse transcriptase family protein [Rhizobium sp. Leaf341]|uniref:reverse transcriptase family protein n=1 Tax=Rhizobium sp. Leaf341 TaxID=1736344 RepID=UPI0009E6BA3D|nr:reverse transcriptase family protein [Rhizobium sp. Leaf341]